MKKTNATLFSNSFHHRLSTGEFSKIDRSELYKLLKENIEYRVNLQNDTPLRKLLEYWNNNISNSCDMTIDGINIRFADNGKEEDIVSDLHHIPDSNVSSVASSLASQFIPLFGDCYATYTNDGVNHRIVYILHLSKVNAGLTGLAVRLQFNLASTATMKISAHHGTDYSHQALRIGKCVNTDRVDVLDRNHTATLHRGNSNKNHNGGIHTYVEYGDTLVAVSSGVDYDHRVTHGFLVNTSNFNFEHSTVLTLFKDTVSDVIDSNVTTDQRLRVMTIARLQKLTDLIRIHRTSGDRHNHNAIQNAIIALLVLGNDDFGTDQTKAFESLIQYRVRGLMEDSHMTEALADLQKFKSGGRCNDWFKFDNLNLLEDCGLLNPIHGEGGTHKYIQHPGYGGFVETSNELIPGSDLELSTLGKWFTANYR